MEGQSSLWLMADLPSQYAAVERLERAIETMQSTIEEDGGNLVVKMKVRPLTFVSHKSVVLTSEQPKAVSETDEQDLAQLMAKAGAENAEVSGDEDDEE